MWSLIERQIALDTHLVGSPPTSAKHPQEMLAKLMGSGSSDSSAVAAAERMLRNSHDALRREAMQRQRRQPSCFEEACAFGNLPAAVQMWASGAIDIPTYRGNYEGSDATPLMWAAYRNQLPVVRFLLDEGAVVNACNLLGHTALHWAIFGGHIDVVRFLLDKGADPALRDRLGHDASFAAAQFGHLPILMLLTEDGRQATSAAEANKAAAAATQPPTDVFHGSNSTYTENTVLLNPATQKPYFRLDPGLRDVEGHSLLHWAAYTNSAAMCTYLIEYWGYEVNVADMTGRTPLIWAAREGFAEVLECLLSHGASRTVKDKDGCTALQHARIRNHPESVYVLRHYPESTTALAGQPHKEGTAQTSTPSGANEEPNNIAGYVTVRERRARGTGQMMLRHILFTLMAASSLLWLGAAYVMTRMLMPLFSYMPLLSYLFKNMIWNVLAGKPERASETGKATQADASLAAAPETPSQASHGIATSVASALRGTWVYRLRDPANLCLFVLLPVFQLYAWTALGLTPVLFAAPLNDTDALARTAPEAVSRLRETRQLVAQLDPRHYLGGTLLRSFFATSGTMLSTTLLALLFGCWLMLVLCKLYERRGWLSRQEEGTLRNSPLWGILARRQFRWLHPRLVQVERHVQIPVRTFYCAERDVLVRRYDGYSILLDSPIGAGNHVFFVLCLTCFTAFEVLLFVWGVRQLSSQMRCSAQGAFYHGALRGFYTRPVLEAELQKTLVTSKPYVKLPLSSLFFTRSWLNAIPSLLLHGLPCRLVDYSDALVRDYVTRGNDKLAWRLYFMFYYYIWPTKANTLGVWITHYSFIAAIFGLYVCGRQWYGVWRGATRIELANPLAPGSNGDLVHIFPPDPHSASPYAPYDATEEEYYEATDPAHARPELTMRGPCIFATSRFGLVNVVAFLCGTAGRRWRDAMSVSPNNTPVKTPLLL